MRARVRYTGTFYVGEVYATCETWFGEWTGWKKVTEPCYTKIGTRLQLKKFADRIGKEFEL